MERAAAVVPLGGHFSPPHDDVGVDDDGNGLYDFLVVKANITVDAGDNYTVGGFLYKDNSTLYLPNGTSEFLEPGNWTVSVYFDGPSINASGVDGPYSAVLFLYDRFKQPLNSTLYTTHPYRHTDFDAVPAKFTPPHSDAGVDTDGDVRFNVLNVYVNLTVNVAAEYYINAVLFDSSDTLILFSSATMALDPGPRTIILPFPGDALNASGIDGPYFVSMGLFMLPLFHPIDQGEHVTAAYKHTDFEEPPLLVSTYAPAAPVIDGSLGAGEWARAHIENLSTVPGNQLPAFLFVMNDDNFLYVGYDAIGDTARGPDDAASIAFDTGNDGQGTFGHEDEFVQGGWAPNDQAHYVFSGGSNWTVHESPFNPNLPNHRGLAGAWGFGPSPRESSNHRIYEFKIPLPLLGVAPGGTIGFFAGSHKTLGGVFDNETYEWSSWPDWSLFPLPFGAYGDLIVATRGDTVPPTIAITSPGPDAIVPANSVTVTWNASDQGSGLERFDVRVDGLLAGTVIPPDMAFTLRGLQDGPHDINVTAYDAGGNSQSDAVRVMVDANPPSLKLDTPTNGAAVSSRGIIVRWTASDAGTGISGYTIQLDGGAAADVPASSTSYAFDGLAEGSHRVVLNATDGVGRSTTVSASFIVDLTVPSVTIDAPHAGYVGTAAVPVSWTATDMGSGLARIEVAVDDHTPIALPGTATSHTLPPVTDGPHAIHVNAVDAAGNYASATVNVTIDTVSPDVAITSPGTGAVIQTSDVTIVFTRGDASGIERVEVAVDGASPTDLNADATSYVLKDLSPGVHRVDVIVFDRAGNSNTATISFQVDTSFLSPSGPYGYSGIGVLAALFLGVVVAAVVIARRRRGTRPPAFRP